MEEIHQKNVVHVDLKSNNIMMDWSDPKDPKASIIDFGVATFVGQVSPFGSVSEEEAEKSMIEWPWYAYETCIGLPLTVKADVVGLSYMILEISEVMSCKPRRLRSLAKRGMSRDEGTRPTVLELLDVTLRTIEAYFYPTDSSASTIDSSSSLSDFSDFSDSSTDSFPTSQQSH